MSEALFLLIAIIILGIVLIIAVKKINSTKPLLEKKEPLQEKAELLIQEVEKLTKKDIGIW